MQNQRIDVASNNEGRLTLSEFNMILKGYFKGTALHCICKQALVGLGKRIHSLDDAKNVMSVQPGRKMHNVLSTSLGQLVCNSLLKNVTELFNPMNSIAQEIYFLMVFVDCSIYELPCQSRHHIPRHICHKWWKHTWLRAAY